MVKQPQRWLTDDEQKLWRAYLESNFRLRKLLNDDLEQNAGFDHLTYEIFVRLSESDNYSMRMTDLAKSVSANKSKLTYRVNELEKQGLVARKVCDEDGRGHWCVLTDKGYSLLEEAAPGHVDAVLNNFMSAIDPSEVSHLTDVLESIGQQASESEK